MTSIFSLLKYFRTQPNESCILLITCGHNYILQGKSIDCAVCTVIVWTENSN